jgi:seryl-tRNA synthetase
MIGIKTFEIDADSEGQLEYFRYENYNLQTEIRELKDRLLENNGKKDDRNQLIKNINNKLESSLISENKMLREMIEEREGQISEMKQKLEEYENDFKDIKVALEVSDVDHEAGFGNKSDNNEVCLDFTLINPASGKGGDKYACVENNKFVIYFPQIYSRLGGKAINKMCVKLSRGDNFADIKNKKSEWKVKYVGN